ncbi:MAG: quinone oxidoreductase [Alphaproteobacteria bacterium]|nr:quinone oxidoreductase [Alphaproteobacteria bacterium]
MKTKRIYIDTYGKPDVLRYGDIAIDEPGINDVLIHHKAIGVNYIDIYHRTGLYPVSLPSGLGLEGVGIIEAVGKKVKDLSVGDRVGYASAPIGAYAEKRIMPADRLVKLPDFLSDDEAATIMLRGLTVEYLVRRTFSLEAHHTLLLQAAAGGLGLLLCQWAKYIGATVIGTVGSKEKYEKAKMAGCDHVIISSEEDIAQKVRLFTNDQGVDVVYDGVGKATFENSLDCLKPRGLMVSFGNASGPVGQVDLAMLNKKGSLFLTRPSLAHYTLTRQELLEGADALFDVLKKGAVKTQLAYRYPLKDAGLAHKMLESRKVTGSIILTV